MDKGEQREPKPETQPSQADIDRLFLEYALYDAMIHSKYTHPEGTPRPDPDAADEFLKGIVTVLLRREDHETINSVLAQGGEYLDRRLTADPVELDTNTGNLEVNVQIREPFREFKFNTLYKFKASAQAISQYRHALQESAEREQAEEAKTREIMGRFIPALSNFAKERLGGDREVRLTRGDWENAPPVFKQVLGQRDHHSWLLQRQEGNRVQIQFYDAKGSIIDVVEYAIINN